MSPLAKSMHQRSISENIPVEERLKRLKENVLPDSPYLLTVPSTFRVSSHQVDDWRRGTPFGPDEQKLQYLSFLSHTVDDTMLKAEGDWDDGNGGIAEKSSQSVSTRRSSSTMSPLPGQERKKKISLEDYKKKTAQGGFKAGPGSVVKPQLQGTVDAPVLPAKKAVPPMEIIPPQVQKRSLEAISQEQDAKPAVGEHSPPPAKKARVSPTPPVAAAIKEKTEQPNAHGFPPLLSPTLPPSIEEELAKDEAKAKAAINEKHGQKMASATLVSSSSKKSQGHSPAPVQASQTSAGDKAVHPKKPEIHVSEPKKSDPNPNTKRLGSTREGVPPPKTPTATLDQRDKGSKPNGISGPKVLSNGTGSSNLEMSSIAHPKPSTDHSEKESLIVKLKIPKSARKNWAALIRLAPRPRKPEASHPISTEKPRDRVKETILTNGLEKVGEKAQLRKVQPTQPGPVKNALSKTGEKRRRLNSIDDPEPSSKRPKPSTAPVVIHKTHTSAPNPKTRTPIRPIIKSPVSSQSASKPNIPNSPPRRALKGAAMQRIASQEAEVQTPSGSTRGGTPTAPASIERGNRDGRSISNPSVGDISSGNSEGISRSSEAKPVNGVDEAALWKEEQNKYLLLGRALKHEADHLLKIGGYINREPTSKDHGAAIAVETVLCYMLGFTAGDEAQRVHGKAGDPTGWRSLLPYIQFVKSVIDQPHLSGLTLQLEAVCREVIQAYEIDRLMYEQNPSGSDDANATRRQRYEEFKLRLCENARLARQAWLQGTSRLSIEKLAESYPRTWEKRATAPRDEDGKEKLVVNQYNGGGFYLPLHSTSTGIEAVRMGWNFLNEWCEQFGVKWEGKMRL